MALNEYVMKPDFGELTHENKMEPLWQWHANMLKDGIAMEKAIWLDWAACRTRHIETFLKGRASVLWTLTTYLAQWPLNTTSLEFISTGLTYPAFICAVAFHSATGYIGGDALYTIYHNHPDFEYSLLVRTQEKGKQVSSAYPKARIVICDLDDAELIEREAGWADIVIHTADSSYHEISARAIAKGLAENHSASRPGFWLHTGGTGILTYFDSEVRKTFRESDDKVFNDLDGVDELVSLPDAAFHGNIGKIVLETGSKHKESVKTAIVCPPTIYDKGRGPVSGRGCQVYELTSFILKEQYAPKIGKGLSRWNHVHIHGLSDMFELLVKAALDPARKNDADIWGSHGYFLAENGEHAWGHVSAVIGKEVQKQGLAKEGQIEARELSNEEAVQSPAGFEAASWGMNSRGKAERAAKFLGWTPRGVSLTDEIPEIVKAEVARAEL